MPVIAKRNGAGLIIINLTPTPQDDFADLVIRESAGESMSRIINLLHQ